MNGLLYAVTNDNKLIEINIPDKEIDYYPLNGSINREDGYFGGAWSTNDNGLFFINGVSGKIFSIDVENKVATHTTTSSGNLEYLDAGNCFNSSSRLEFNCNNGIDDDGDGLSDCEDPDCLNSNKCVTEICMNGIDDDGDGYIDCSDSECFYLDECYEICDNGIDDNNNGQIDENDEFCNTTSGNTGGLESNSRLIDAIADRHVNRRKANYKLAPFPILENRPISPIGGRSDVDMSLFIPVDAIPETITKISTPSDLVEITNATEVFTSDIFEGERRLATMMILRTNNEVYEHSKTICDRIDGAQIKEVSTIFYEDKQLITSEIIHANGQKEFALSFTMHFDEDGAHIENHWVKDKYSVKEEVFNFQIWSNTLDNLISLVEGTFERINQMSPIATIESSKPPRVFVTHGRIINGKLQLFINNKNASKSIALKGRKAETELSELTDVAESYQLTGTANSQIVHEMEDAFNIGVRIETENGDVDDLFFADGKWGLNYDEQDVTIKNYSIESSGFEEGENNSYNLRRNVSFSAITNGTVSIYRSLDPKFRPKNLEEFKQLSFTANGNAVLDVIVVSSDVVLWEDQLKTTIILNENENVFNLKKEDFEGHENIDWSKIEMVHFVNNNPSQIRKNVDFEIKDLSFNNLENSGHDIDLISEGALKIHPNPISSSSRILIHGIEESNFTMNIINSSGTIIRQDQGLLLKGINSFDLSKDENMNPGIYFVQLTTSTGIGYQGKFMIDN